MYIHLYANKFTKMRIIFIAHLEPMRHTLCLTVRNHLQMQPQHIFIERLLVRLLMAVVQ